MNDNFVFREGATVIVSSKQTSFNTVLYLVLGFVCYHLFIEDVWSQFRDIICFARAVHHTGSLANLEQFVDAVGRCHYLN